MVPFHEPPRDLGAEARHPKIVEFERLDQGHHRGGVPGRDAVEIRREVAGMRPGERMRLPLARRKGDADDPAGGSGGALGDAQVVGAGGHGRVLQLRQDRSPP